MAQFLTSEEGEALLRIARGSLQQLLLQTPFSLEQFDLTPRLQEKHGCFVTIHHRRELRGCIGNIRGVVSLAEAARDNAVSAAARDPRFQPLRAEDLPETALEVSVLCPGDAPDSPFIRVQDLKEVVIGRDGLFLERGGPHRSGLLLPQVAVHQGWNAEQFLAGILQKTGVPSEALQEPQTQLYRFETQNFSEAGF